jgi:hypothetical protein
LTQIILNPEFPPATTSSGFRNIQYYFNALLNISPATHALNLWNLIYGTLLALRKLDVIETPGSFSNRFHSAGGKLNQNSSKHQNQASGTGHRASGRKCKTF